MSSKIIKCAFTSEWDDGAETVTTACTYDPVTGKVTPEVSERAPDGSLSREYVTLPDGRELDVCMECHEVVLVDGKCTGQDCAERMVA